MKSLVSACRASATVGLQSLELGVKRQTDSQPPQEVDPTGTMSVFVVVSWMASHWGHGPPLSSLDPPGWNPVYTPSQVDIGGWMIVATSTQGFEQSHELQGCPAVHGP